MALGKSRRRIKPIMDHASIRKPLKAGSLVFGASALFLLGAPDLFPDRKNIRSYGNSHNFEYFAYLENE